MSQLGVPTKNLEDVLAGAGQSSFILGQNLTDDLAQREKSRPTSDLTPIPAPYRVSVGQPDEPKANTKTGTLTPSTATDPNGNRIIDSDLTFTTLTKGGPYDATQAARARAIDGGLVLDATVPGAPRTTGTPGGYGAMSGGTPGGATTATKVVQDLTFTAKLLGLSGGAISIAYTDTETAGAEVVTVTGNAISVGIESGVSTATMVLAALAASSAALALVSVALTGTAGNFQVTAAAAFLLGGANTPADGEGALTNSKGSFSAINRTGSRNHASINVIARPGDTVNGGLLF
jgi:hypothetical protein